MSNSEIRLLDICCNLFFSLVARSCSVVCDVISRYRSISGDFLSGFVINCKLLSVISSELIFKTWDFFNGVTADALGGLGVDDLEGVAVNAFEEPDIKVVDELIIVEFEELTVDVLEGLTEEEAENKDLWRSNIYSDGIIIIM